MKEALEAVGVSWGHSFQIGVATVVTRKGTAVSVIKEGLGSMEKQ